MLDKLSFDITAPEGVELDMEQLLDPKQMDLEGLEDYLEGLEDAKANLQPGDDSRLEELEALIAEAKAQIEQRKA